MSSNEYNTLLVEEDAPLVQQPKTNNRERVKLVLGAVGLGALGLMAGGAIGEHFASQSQIEYELGSSPAEIASTSSNVESASMVGATGTYYSTKDHKKSTKSGKKKTKGTASAVLRTQFDDVAGYTQLVGQNCGSAFLAIGVGLDGDRGYYASPANCARLCDTTDTCNGFVMAPGGPVNVVLDDVTIPRSYGVAYDRALCLLKADADSNAAPFLVTFYERIKVDEHADYPTALTNYFRALDQENRWGLGLDLERGYVGPTGSAQECKDHCNNYGDACTGFLYSQASGSCFFRGALGLQPAVEFNTGCFQRD